MKYWLVRKWEDSRTPFKSWKALGVFQIACLRTGRCGDYHIGHVIRSNFYAVWNLKPTPVAIIELITEAEYQTYLEFEIFSEPLDFPDLRV